MKEWPTFVPIPKPEHPVVGANGVMTPEWYRYFKAADAILKAVPVLELNDLADVDADTPADADVLTWVDADGTWQPA